MICPLVEPHLIGFLSFVSDHRQKGKGEKNSWDTSQMYKTELPMMQRRLAQFPADVPWTPEN